MRVRSGAPDPLLILASSSPRRRELLARLGAPFEVRAADLDETPHLGESPEDLVRRLATSKAEAVLAAAPEPDIVVVAADTIVVVDGVILTKPLNAADATVMLGRLAGCTHTVLTGVAVARGTWPAGSADSGVPPPSRTVSVVVEVEATEVTFVELTDADIAWYVATGEPLDKAGGYGIQGQGAVFVSSIVGSHDNVVGLGLATTRRLLTQAGFDPLTPTA